MKILGIISLLIAIVGVPILLANIENKGTTREERYYLRLGLVIAYINSIISIFGLHCLLS